MSAFDLASDVSRFNPVCDCGHSQRQHAGALVLISPFSQTRCLVDDCDCHEFRAVGETGDAA